MQRNNWLKISLLLITMLLVIAVGWTSGKEESEDYTSSWAQEVVNLRSTIEDWMGPYLAQYHWNQLSMDYPIEAGWIAEDFSGGFSEWLLEDDDKAVELLENMLGAYIRRNHETDSKITAYATSEETAGGYDVAANALDGSPSTIWHTKWDNSDRLPQSITIIMEEPTEINQVTYLPRQDGNQNGMITEYRLSYSIDGNKFVELDHGRWSLNSQSKVVKFSPVEATHVRLEAIQGHGGVGWASAAEIEIGTVLNDVLDLSKEERTIENLLTYYEQMRSEKRSEMQSALENVIRDDSFDDILFIKRERLPNHEHLGHHMVDQYFGHNQIPGGGLYILENAFSDNPTLRNVLEDSTVVNGPRAGKKLQGGTFLSPDLSYCGTKILFAYTDARRQKHVWNEENVFHIFSVNIDGSELTQLTSGPYNDFDPIWLPDGDVVFISERRGGFGRCHQRPVPTYTLHRMSPDGSNIRMISYHETNEWNPAVDNQGMIIYTRWDYVDRGATHPHSAWITNPAGEDPRALVLNYPITQLYMNNVSHLRDVPLMQMSLRPIPNSNKVVGIAAEHHGQNYGPVIIIDPDIEDDDHTSTVVNVTPSTGGYPESGGGSTNYATPYALSEELFLVGYSPDSGANTKYGMYLLNVEDGKEVRELLYYDSSISLQSPIPVKPRKAPNAIRVPDMPQGSEEWNVVAHPGASGLLSEHIDPGLESRTAAPDAEVFVADVYNSLIPFPEGATITELRIWQVYPKTTDLANLPKISYENRQSDWAGRNTRGLLGSVPVESDGSVYFKLPAGIPVFFQAVGDDGIAVQSMRSVTQVVPGQEFLSCNGCHEPRHTAPPNPTETPKALLREPSEIAEETSPGARPMNFPTLIQPILDNNCISCHNGQDQRPDLRGNIGRDGWFVSYNNLEPYVFLFDKHYRGNWDQTYPRTEPGGFGAGQSRLYDRLKSGHGDLSEEDLHRFVIWMDSHILPFYGEYYNTDEQLKGIQVEPLLY